MTERASLLRDRWPLDGLSILRFTVAYALTAALILLAVQSLGTLFLAGGALPLVWLSAVAGLISVPLVISPLYDWACWLIAQVFAVAAALRLAAGPVSLVPAMATLPTGALSFSFPNHATATTITIDIGGHSAAWLLLVLLGLLTWELTWGVLWLVLRAGYIWPAIVLAGANLLTATNVAAPVEGRFLPFVALALLLVLWHTWSERLLQAAAQTHELLPRRWAYGSLAGGLCALVIVLPLAWAATPNWQGSALKQWAAGTWSRLRPQLSNPLHVLSTSGGLSLGAGGFGDRIPLDGPFRPYKGVIMRVRGVPPGLQPYWRGQVYDSYENGSWQMSNLRPTEPLPPLTVIPADVPRHSDRRITVQVEVAQPANSLLFAPGRPIAVSVAAQSQYAPYTSGSEPIAVYAAAPLQAGSRYAVTAELPFTEPRLDAPGPPPDPRYLALPAALDPGVVQLAERFATYYPNPLDRARAIESYLRNPRFTYDTTVGAPPNGADPIAYFLFSSHRGYCVHFASAMALLARATGLPARVVGGYASGQRVGDAWVVRGQDAHTWPEIFFQGTGWVPFEPTPGYSVAFVSGIGHRTAHQPAGNDKPAHRLTPARRQATVLPTRPGVRYPAQGATSSVPLWPIGLLGLALLAIAALTARNRSEQRGIAGIYRQLCRSARVLALRPRAWQTPHEFARAYAACSPEEYADVASITALYASARYGRAGATPSPQELQDARQALRRLRRRWLARKLRLR